ncbi:MAG: hypothetical protein M3O70_04210, partial [Actinomycetota bacterium]|nr:hypothetical protein [Actinomycetota bacterium]
LKRGTGAGSLVLLRREPDKAEGRFDPTYAAFMSIRPASAPTEPVAVVLREPLAATSAAFPKR